MIGMAVVLLLSSCSTTKYVPKDKYLLDKVSFDGSGNTVNNNDLTKHLRQKPNFKAFGLFRIYLGVYNLSGRDSTKRINRKLRNIGEAPVVYVLCAVTNKFTPRELAVRLLREYNILIKDCTQKCGGNYVRLAVRDTEDNNQLIEALNSL